MNTAIESAFLAAVVTLPVLAGVDQFTGVSGEENEAGNAATIVHVESDRIPTYKTPSYDNSRSEPRRAATRLTGRKFSPSYEQLYDFHSHTAISLAKESGIVAERIHGTTKTTTG